METKFRGGRQLKRNHTSALPRYIICFDTETRPTLIPDGRGNLSHEFRLGHAITARIVGTKPIGVKHVHIRSQGEFWQLVNSMSGLRHTLWIIAHNALYDFETIGGKREFSEGRIVPDWPRTKRTKCQGGDSGNGKNMLAVVDGPPTIVACRVAATQGRVVFVDTLNWFPGTLDQLGKDIGLHKMPMPAWKESDYVWGEYCRNDTQIVFDAFIKLIQFVSDNDFGMFRFTAAGQAMSAFRHKFMTHPVYFHDEPIIKQLERRACFGGRSEVFFKGHYHGDVYLFDVNSLFPSVMLNNDFPYTIESYDHGNENMVDAMAAVSSGTIAECTLETWRNAYPKRIVGRTIYPYGLFNTVLAGPELLLSVCRSELRAIRNFNRYKLAPIFSKWVSSLWDLRRAYKLAGNLTYDRFVKLLMNSLYGKFAQLTPVWQTDHIEPVIEPWTQWSKYDQSTDQIINFRSFGWQAERMIGRTEKDGTLPAISAYVTSYARIRMNELRQTAGERNVFYQAVDSLIVNRAGRDNLIQAGEVDDQALGKLKLELYADYVTINGIGDYSIGGKRVLAGCHRGATEIEDGVYLQRVFSAKDQLFAGYKANTVIERDAIFRAKRKYCKGVETQTGWVDPFILPNDELLELASDSWVSTIS